MLTACLARTTYCDEFVFFSCLVILNKYHIVFCLAQAKRFTYIRNDEEKKITLQESNESTEIMHTRHLLVFIN